TRFFTDFERLCPYRRLVPIDRLLRRRARRVERLARDLAGHPAVPRLVALLYRNPVAVDELLGGELANDAVLDIDREVHLARARDLDLHAQGDEVLDLVGVDGALPHRRLERLA